MSYTQTQKPQAKWYVDLMNRLKQLIQETGMPENASKLFQEFMLSVAREQYMAGNRSGIRYAREQARKEKRSY